MSEDLSTGSYVRLLAALFGFYAPLEGCLERLQSVVTAWVPLRKRAALLQQDLQVLNFSPTRVPICDAMPKLITVDHLAGALYVVEGATLGGQVIARTVMQRFGVGRNSGASFFIGDGSRTAGRWKRVLAWLEERERAASAADEILDGACQTFAALVGWFRKQGVVD